MCVAARLAQHLLCFLWSRQQSLPLKLPPLSQRTWHLCIQQTWGRPPLSDIFNTSLWLESSSPATQHQPLSFHLRSLQRPAMMMTPPVAFTSAVMKCFETLVVLHCQRSPTGLNLRRTSRPLNFHTLKITAPTGTSVSCLTSPAAFSTTFCNWILDFLTSRPLKVWIGTHIYVHKILLNASTVCWRFLQTSKEGYIHRNIPTFQRATWQHTYES